MTINDYLQMFLRHWRSLLIGLLLGMLAGVGASIYLGYLPRYNATATVAVGGDVATVDDNTSYLSLADEFAATYADLATRAPVLQAVIDELGLEMTPAQVRGSISTTIIKDTHLIEITVSQRDPRLAADMANAIARQLITLPTLRVRNFVVPIEAAAIPTKLDPTWVVLALIMGGVGFLLVGGVIFLYEFLRNVVYSGETLEHETDIPTLIEVHSRTRRFGRRNGTPWRTDEVGTWWALAQHCRRRLQHGTVVNGLPPTIAVAAPGEGESQALIAANLAAGWAESGERVVLLNTDAASEIEEWFGLPSHSEMGRPSQIALYPTDVPNLQVASWPLEDGRLPPNGRRLDELLHLLRGQADVVILNTPPLVSAPGGLHAVRHAHGALLTVTAGKTSVAHAVEARDVLALVDVECWGAVVARA